MSETGNLWIQSPNSRMVQIFPQKQNSKMQERLSIGTCQLKGARLINNTRFPDNMTIYHIKFVSLLYLRLRFREALFQVNVTYNKNLIIG